MKKLALVLILSVVLGIGAYALKTGQSEKEAVVSSSQHAAMEPTPRPGSAGSRAKEAVDSFKAGDPEAAAPSAALLSADAAPRELTKSLAEMSDRESLASALSVEEQAWLRARGYPAAWELENLDLLDWDAIRRAASQGDAIAQTLLAEQLLRSGDTERARAMFAVASSHGSLYAHMRASLLHALSVDPAHVMHPQDAYVVFRLATALAAQLGDQRAADFAYAHTRHLTARERQSLDATVLRSLPEYHESWQRSMHQLGRPDLANLQMRPNRERWRPERRGEPPTLTVLQTPSRFRRPGGG
ncbi:hypothetical protein [Aquimonas voraii]|uniref:Uncharacterized protein n=1 Tax=Aquimonas voraii TaxID=265719 RepID=A0A1G6UBZ0_9GAMM|nr:hypothetical protein [Aquimonas voraii]SDD38769.1 hypothetical protein SAMN04488509_102263 [Aquimonas voraii]